MSKPLLFLTLLIMGICVADLRGQQNRTPPVAPPTTQALQGMLDAKQYREVIQESQKMLRLKGAAVQSIDKFNVYLIRAEAQLQLKQQAPAMESYREAAKETDDPTQAGVPKAMTKLIQKSKAFMYTPKPTKDPTKPAAPLNIIDPAERKLALTALFEDEWKPTQTKIDALKKRGATSLPPILEAAALAGEMRGLEMAATGTDAQTSTALSDLTESASRMMSDYLDQKTRRVEEIDRAANLPSSDNLNETSRRGLTAPQTADLKEISGTCAKLKMAAESVANSAGANGTTFKAIADRSADLGKRAHDLLIEDYSAYQDPNANRPIQRGPGQQQQIPQIPNRPGGF